MESDFKEEAVPLTTHLVHLIHDQGAKELLDEDLRTVAMPTAFKTSQASYFILPLHGCVTGKVACMHCTYVCMCSCMLGLLCIVQMHI